jgi:histone deacetylase 1/2
MYSYGLQAEVPLGLTIISMEYYGPRYKLEVLANNQDNHNPPEYLESIK